MNMTLFGRSGFVVLTVIFAVSLSAFSSCSARIDGQVREGGAAEISVSTSIGPRTVRLIRSLRGFMGDPAAALPTDEPVLDGPAISRSMAAAPGIRQISLGNTGPSALEGNISITRVGDFMAIAGAGTKLITYTEEPAGTNIPASSSIIITMTLETAPELIAMLSPEVEEYLSALMAPAALGETSTRREYLDLLAAIYGRPLADEINAARIRALIEFPRPVKSTLGGRASGRQAEFDIPLVDLLVLETPLRYEVHW